MKILRRKHVSFEGVLEISKVGLDADAGLLTNFEVLDLLRRRGATSDPLGSLGAVSSSECKVFDYLVQSAAGNQTRECIHEFLKQFENNFEKDERLNIINVRPKVGPSIYPFIKNCETRLKKEGDELLNELEELAQLVNKTLSPPSEMPEGVEQ